MILVIDNYDSFVYTLARYIGLCGIERKVIRNDKITTKEIRALKPEAILLSPGPCAPDQAGICNDVIKYLSGEIPILGICLGHQCIGQVFGGTIKKHPPYHGKISSIHHDSHPLFRNLPHPFSAARYHSLIVENIEKTPLQRIGWLADGTVMGLAHKQHKTYGVQFHPESVLTSHGLQIIKNFIDLYKD